MTTSTWSDRESQTAPTALRITCVWARHRLTSDDFTANVTQTLDTLNAKFVQATRACGIVFKTPPVWKEMMFSGVYEPVMVIYFGVPCIGETTVDDLIGRFQDLQIT